MTLVRARKIVDAVDATDHVTLDYEHRFLRRRRLQTAGGDAFLVDLPETRSLGEGDAFLLDDGRIVAVHPAPEALLEIRGGNLARLAWHIGNRHTPARIEGDRILVRDDHVLEGMLNGLGACVARVIAPFEPEGGAYGHGRTMGHDHGHDSHHAHDAGSPQASDEAHP